MKVAFLLKALIFLAVMLTSQTAQAFSTVLGTQAIGGRYQFTKEPQLVEAARAILSMGSGTLKFPLSPDKSDAIQPKSLVEIVQNARSVKTVLDMPFSNYLI